MIKHPLREFRAIATMTLALRDQATTCRALLEDCLRVYDFWEPRLHAWVAIDREGALMQADLLDEEIRSGRRLGPLHGIPIGVKDIVDVAGFPTRAGANAWSKEPAKVDAPIVASLRKAGAIILGKTVTTPYAWIDPPETRNPWHFGRTPGGSSSGSAVAVATGMVMAAVGTQTGGSIIRPAAFCGAVGWKPSHRTKAPLTGIVPFAPSLDTPGFLAREATDLYILQQATGGALGGSHAPISSHYRMAECLRRLDGSIDPDSGVDQIGEELLDSGENFRTSPRLGRLRGFFEDRAEPVMNEMLDTVLDRWAVDGCEVVEVKLPAVFDRVHQAHRVVMSFEAAMVHRDRFTRMPEDYPPRMTDIIQEGLRHSEADYREALKVGQAVAGFFRPDLQAFITPAAVGPPPGRETTGDPVFNSPWTFGGQPTVSLPIGVTKDRLPLAAQLIGRDGGEGDLMGAAQWCAYDPEVWPFDFDREF